MFQHTALVQVSLAHKYWNGQWSHQRNREVYGSSASSDGVGSNLRVEIAVYAENDLELKSACSRVRELADHRCLFDEIPQFHSEASTLERITRYLADEVFAMPVSVGQWLYLDVIENGRWSCRARPESEVLELSVRERNLTLHLKGKVQPESGVVIERSVAREAVDSEFARGHDANATDEAVWARSLLENLQVKVHGLSALTVDLGCHRTISVNS